MSSSRHVNTHGHLDHDKRRTIFQSIDAHPGQTLADVAQETGISRMTVEYHARRLVRSGLLATEKRHGRRRYFPTNESFSDIQRSLFAAYENEARGPILYVIAAYEGEPTVSEIADMVDRSPSTVSDHLNRLETDGLIQRERDGRTNRIILTEDYTKHISEFLR